MQALEGIRVVDAATMVAGPLGASILGDFGADVIKVEPIAGDESRTFGPGRDGMSGVYSGVNRNKRAIALDLRTEDGLRIFHELCADADVLIENMLPAVRERFGLTAGELTERHPHLIALNVSGYGDTGPLAGRPAMDPVAQAITGFMAATGWRGGEPVKAGPPIADSAAGYLVAIAALVAILARGQQSGARASPARSRWWERCSTSRPPGSGSTCSPTTSRSARATAATSTRPTTPTGLATAARSTSSPSTTGTSASWRRRPACPSCSDDPRFDTPAQRLAHADEVDAALAPWFAEHDRDEVVAAAGRPRHHLRAGAGLRRSGRAPPDPVPWTSSSTSRMTSWATSASRASRSSSTAARERIRRPPTHVGEHTAEVLAGLGHDAEDIARLTAAGVVR